MITRRVRTVFYISVIVAERESGGETEVGVAAAREAAERHHPGMPRRFRAQHHWKEARHVRAVQPRPEGKDATHRLLTPGRQGKHISTSSSVIQIPTICFLRLMQFINT